ncbi:PilZ domain-containing protein, partial [Pyxidicoccus sp. 3LG]
PRAMLAPLIEMNQGEAEHRQFPRAQLATRVEVWVDAEGGDRRFAASLTSVNVSVSGAFLESTFYLPLGTVLGVRFALEPGAAPVEARAEIVREERSSGPGDRSGFGIRFIDFNGQTEVALARLFVGMRLRAFAEEYLKSQRARSLPNELERVVDVLAAWELLKATTSAVDPWQGG